MNAHIKRRHPDVDILKGFTRNLRSSWGTKAEGPYTDLTPNPRTDFFCGKPSGYTNPIITQNKETCSCKYYNFVSFLINNGTNIEKVKENIILLKSLDNLK